MIREIITATMMFWADSAWAADSTAVPEMVPALTCRYRDPAKIKQCLDRKNQKDLDPYQDMWDPTWVSTITPIPEQTVADLPQKPKSVKKPLTSAQ